MITVDQFRLRFKEFEDYREYCDDRIQMIIDDAITCYIGDNESCWCGKYDIALSYLTAHMLTKSMQTEAGDTSNKQGVVTNKAAGGVSVTRKVSMSNTTSYDDWFASTAYGQQFLNLRDSCFVAVTVANCL